MIRPTPRAAFLFLMSIPVALLVVSSYRDAWYVSFYLPVIVLMLIGADITMALPSGRLQSDMRGPTRLHVGEAGMVDLDLIGDGYQRDVPVQALLELTGDTATPRPISGLMTGGRLNLNLAITPYRRGQVRVEALWLRWYGPLGFIVMSRRHPVGENIDVVPDIRGIHDAALQFFSRDAVYGVKTQRMRGEGSEFDNLCEYAQGMDNRFIDWKRSARHRKLLCKEFRQERNNPVVFGFDTGHLMLEPVEGVPRLDHAIKAGLLLGWISLYGGDLVGGCGFDARFRSFIEPGRGMPYFTRFQNFAADLAYRTEETNFTLGLAELNSRLKRRSLVVLFTEFVDTISAELLIESLQLMARRHVVIFVTLRDPTLLRVQEAAPEDFQRVAESVIVDDFLRERAVVLERIARLGVHCLDVPAQAVSAALLNRYLMIKQRGLL